MIRDSFLPEFDYEMATTRRTLEAVSEYKLAWKPHDKSFSLGALSTHLADLCDWGRDTLTADSFDLEPNGIPWKPKPEVTSVSEILDRFDRSTSAMRAELAIASDEHLLANWSLCKNGVPLMTMPRVAVIRTWILNHVVHHRGQLSVYLRLTGSKVPSIYGPSADDVGGM
jgi:uncharacterized damage-inducible protein DinB